jgi:hypothetical protein
LLPSSAIVRDNIHVLCDLGQSHRCRVHDWVVSGREQSFGTYLTQFFVPTLLVNILGSISLVAALGHAQVVGGNS